MSQVIVETVDPIGTFAPFGEFDESLFNSDTPGGDIQSVGVDSGATLVKICIRRADGSLHFATWASPSCERIVDLLERLAPEHIGLTGCGSADLHPLVSGPASNPIEFDAWGCGANEMLRRLGEDTTSPYLLVAIGTGTSMLRVEGDNVERVGGTALGGGSALGLGLVLTGARTPEELNVMALKGARQNVDLMVTDLFENAADVGAVIASSFGKIARSVNQDNATATPPSASDLAAAAIGIVSDNIGLLATAHAKGAGVNRIIYGGSTLLAHPQIGDVMRGFGLIMGHETVILPEGGHAGALGAMLMGAR